MQVYRRSTTPTTRCLFNQHHSFLKRDCLNSVYTDSHWGSRSDATVHRMILTRRGQVERHLGQSIISNYMYMASDLSKCGRDVGVTSVWLASDSPSVMGERRRLGWVGRPILWLVTSRSHASMHAPGPRGGRYICVAYCVYTYIYTRTHTHTHACARTLCTRTCAIAARINTTMTKSESWLPDSFPLFPTWLPWHSEL